MKEAQAYIKNYKETKFLPTLNFEGDLMVGEEQLAEMLQEYADQQLLLHGVVGQSEQLCQCEDAPTKHFVKNWCDDCQKKIV